MARAYHTNGNRKRIEVRAPGKTDAASKHALQWRVEETRGAYLGGDRTLNQDTKVSRAAEVWLDRKGRQRRNGRPLGPGTLYGYQGYVRRYVTGHELIADVTLRETKTSAASRRDWPLSPTTMVSLQLCRRGRR